MIAKRRPTALTDTELSPLDQIRYTEAEFMRQVATAREAAEKTVEQERAQAIRIKKEAQEAGRREGQSRCKDLVAEAEREARLIVVHAHQRSEELRRRGQRQMVKAVSHAVKIILGDVDSTQPLDETKGIES